MSFADVEENPNPTPAIISEITIVPSSGREVPLMITRDDSVIRSQGMLTRAVPFSGTLPWQTIIYFYTILTLK